MTKKSKFDFDLIVIGSGAGGSTAAVLAARSGMSVAIVESDTFGGDAPNYSDVPMASLLQSSQLYDQARKGIRFGISSSALRYNFPTILNWKNTAIKRTGTNGNRRFYEESGVKTIDGLAHFLSSHEISVNHRRFTAKNFLIATGAVPIKPDIKNLENVNYLTPRSILSIVRPPKSLLIVGGGSTGVEIAQFFAELGTKVLIAEIAPRLLPHEDEEVGQLMGQILNDSHGIKVLTSSRVIAVESNGGVKKVIFLRGGEEHSVHVDDILIATGKTPATDIGLENAGVKYTKKGIDVNDHLQTSVRHIFAAGDVIGGESSTTRALYESQVVANNLTKRSKIIASYTAMPRITMTFPIVASTGIREDEAMKHDLKIKKSLAPLSQTSRSNTADFKNGFVKIITNHAGKVIGATIVAPDADSMIHELGLAIKCELSVNDIANLPHAFLSWSEAIKFASSRIK